MYGVNNNTSNAQGAVHLNTCTSQAFITILCIHPDERVNSVTHIDGFSGGYGHECCSETGQEMVQLGTR